MACLCRMREGAEIYIQLTRILGSRRSWVVCASSRSLYALERPSVLVVQGAGRASWSVWTGMKSLSHPGIQSPECPARSDYTIHAVKFRTPETNFHPEDGGRKFLRNLWHILHDIRTQKSIIWATPSVLVCWSKISPPPPLKLETETSAERSE
jgi:hypothetical protein